MHHVSKVVDVIIFPARAAVGTARFGLRTTGRVLGWAAEQVVGTSHVRDSARPVTAPDAPVGTASAGSWQDVDPMTPTRTPPVEAPAPAPARKKVPAGRVPLKSAPTPSLTPALESLDPLDDVPQPTPAPPAKKAAAKKAPAKNAPAKKSAAKKAPSKKAAVLAPALGISESEVEQTRTPTASDLVQD